MTDVIHSSKTVTFTGPVTLTATLTMARVGKLVTLSVPFTYATRLNPTSAFYAAPGTVSSGYLPTSQRLLPIIVLDTAYQSGILYINTDGSLEIYVSPLAGFSQFASGLGIDVTYYQ
jgi:hypothetical protein